MKVIAIAGAHASGKSTFVKSLAKHPAFSKFLIFEDGSKLLSGKKFEKIDNLQKIINTGYDTLLVGNWLLKSIYKPIIEWSDTYGYELLYIVSMVSVERLKGEIIQRKIKNNKPIENLDSWGKGDAGLRYLKEAYKALKECNYPKNVNLYIVNHTDTVGDWSQWEGAKQEIWRFLNVVS